MPVRLDQPGTAAADRVPASREQVLRSLVRGKRLPLNDDQRRRLAASGGRVPDELLSQLLPIKRRSPSNAYRQISPTHIRPVCWSMRKQSMVSGRSSE